MSIKEKKQKIISEFELFDDWMDKYNYLIELGKKLPVYNDEYKTNDKLISDCQSQMWLHAEFKDDKVYFYADSDAIITKGIAYLLLSVLSEESPDDIINASIDFVDTIGLTNHLSPTRSNGLHAMVKQMKLYALVFKTL